MKVYFVGAGPGDIELLTVKATRLLREAAYCIYAGSLVNPNLLSLLPADAKRYDSAAMDLGQILEVIGQARGENRDVIRLHTGEPSIYGAIGEQMDELDKLGIDYEVVPGISSFQAAAAALRVELTAPEVSQTVILTRTAGRTPMPAGEELARLAAIGATMCIFLSSDKLDAIAAELAERYGSDCPAAVVYHASWADQRVLRGHLSDIAEKTRAAGITRTAIVIVGRAIGRPLVHASKLYDRTFGHGYREAKP